MQFATVDKSFLTVTVAINDVDYVKSKEAWLCHKSQYTKEMIEGIHTLLRGSLQNTMYFQPHHGDKNPRQDLF